RADGQGAEGRGQPAGGDDHPVRRNARFLRRGQPGQAVHDHAGVLRPAHRQAVGTATAAGFLPPSSSPPSGSRPTRKTRQPMNIRTAICLLALAGAIQATPLLASPPDPTEDRMMMGAGFLAAHPDLRYRLLGLEEFRKGNHEEAFRFFLRAAFYADKPSQGMVAEMYW